MNPLIQAWSERWQIPPAALHELAVMTTLPDLTQERIIGESEANTQQQIRITGGQNKTPMWRNNNGAFKDEDGRWIRFGLGNDSVKLSKVWKSPDLCGIQYGTGKFIGCEVKEPNWTKPRNDRDRAQQACLNQINACGGIGFFASSVSDFIRKVLNK